MFLDPQRPRNCAHFQVGAALRLIDGREHCVRARSVCLSLSGCLAVSLSLSLVSVSVYVSLRGRARADLGDTMCDGIGVADLGGRILKWAKTDEKL